MLTSYGKTVNDVECSGFILTSILKGKNDKEAEHSQDTILHPAFCPMDPVHEGPPVSEQSKLQLMKTVRQAEWHATTGFPRLFQRRWSLPGEREDLQGLPIELLTASMEGRPVSGFNSDLYYGQTWETLAVDLPGQGVLETPLSVVTLHEETFDARGTNTCLIKSGHVSVIWCGFCSSDRDAWQDACLEVFI